MVFSHEINSDFVIAGLSVAQAVEKAFDSLKHPNVLVCVGPGTYGTDLHE